MSWKPEQLLQHPKVNDLLGVNIKPQAQSTKSTLPAPSQDPITTPPAPSQPGQLTFTVIGPPMGKPRMTQRDVWKKRPVVLRYHDYCDRIREAAPNLISKVDVYAIDVKAYIAMPESWPKKKKEHLCGFPCRQKPDWDNIGKAVCDALFKEDSAIADGRTRKFWCRPDDQRTEVKLWYEP